MRMPLISRILFTLSAIGLTVGAHRADLSPSHLFNDRWPPHAKFRTGQTLSMSVLLSVLTVFLLGGRHQTGARPSLQQQGLPLHIGSHRRRQSRIQTPIFTILSFDQRTALD